MTEVAHVTFRAVVLAAGASRRMGAPKLLLPYRGRPSIDRVLEACARWDPLVVGSDDVANYLDGRANVRIVRNRHPERGMSHSLALADAHVDACAALVVLLADKPLVSERLIADMCDAAEGADITHPMHPSSGEPGHPVIFGPRARAKIAMLPAGDSLRTLRDDPALVRRAVPTADCGAYMDIDTAADFER